jgi:hypothetical protein
MIMAVGVLVFMAICALSLIGLGDSHGRVTRILNELQEKRSEDNGASQTSPIPETASQKNDVFAELGFTRSLLALSKVGSPNPCEVPGLGHDESSLLALVRRSQSKNPAPAL